MSDLRYGEIDERSFKAGRRLPAGSPEQPDLRIIAVREPSDQQVDAIVAGLGCDPRVARRAHERHVRARADDIGNTRILTLRPARYLDATEEVVFGDLQLIVGPDYAVLLARHDTFPLERVLDELEARPDQLEQGPFAVLHAALDEVVDGYDPVIVGLENDIDEIEDAVFSQDAAPLRRIYGLIREVIGFQRASEPLGQMLADLLSRDDLPVEEQRNLRDAQERAVHAYARADSFRTLLENVLNVNLALETKALSEASNQQTEQAKKISGWAAILFTPTLIGGIYGMNFRRMPELHWQYGYPFALGLMAAMALTLYVVFKRRDWL